MNCKECLSIVEEYVEDGLDPQTSGQTAAHIFACGSCRTIYEQLKNEQEIYSRYLSKIKEQPTSWDAVRTKIRKGSSSAGANAATNGAGFYERFVGVFFRRPLFGAMAVLVLLVGIGFGLYRNYFRKDASLSGVTSKGPAVRENKTPESPLAKDATPAGEGSPNLKNNDGGKPLLTAVSGRPGQEKTRAKSTISDIDTMNKSAAVFDSSEAAFNRLIEKCEMVLRSFRNAVPETDSSPFDVSYERRLAKELLDKSVKFRREAQNQGNLPVETLLADLEGILRDITRLPKKPTSADANLIKGRIRESGIIAKLQIQSSIAGNSE